MKKNFHERKKERTENFFQNIYRWRLRTCTACNGSGHYDSFHSPKCSSCDGSGRERFLYKLEQPVTISVSVI